MQSATSSLLDEAKDKERLPFEWEGYNLTDRSTFLDIGSGFGKPVFHAAMQCYCLSRGIEVVPARVIASEGIKFEIEEA
jgi:cyclopropane fatty-acyl-phospholipid synthase-like methyltransferase